MTLTIELQNEMISSSNIDGFHQNLPCWPYSKVTGCCVFQFAVANFFALPSAIIG